MPDSIPLRVLLADDHEIVRDGLRTSFEAAGVSIVGEASDGAEAVEMALRHVPDVVLMDLSMPGTNGIEATAQLTRAGCPSRVVMLTMHDDVDSTRRALESGAVGYLTKGIRFAEVLATVRDAASGEIDLSPTLAERMVAEANAHGEEPLLSDRQVEILQAIADGMSTKQVAIALHISTKTVHNHLNATYRRLDTQSLTHAVLGALRLGLIDLHRPATDQDDDG